MRNFLIILIIILSVIKISSGIFSDAFIDMRFLLGAKRECIFFKVHQPRSRIEISVSTLNTELALSVEFFSPSEKLLENSRNSGRQYIRYPEKEGEIHEVGDYQLCIGTNSRQTVQISLIIVIYEKTTKNIDVASNLKRKISYDATKITLENFEKITTNIDEKLKIMKAEQAKRAIVEKIDRTYIETAFEMINFWHIMRVFAVIFIAGFQVHAIRNLLTVKR